MMKKLAILAIAVASLAGRGAHAQQQWPASIVGAWNGWGNQSALAINITSQSGGETCQQITGTIASDTLLGYYCPASGRFNFLRTTTGGLTYQSFTGNLTETVSGAPSMGGIFADYIDNPSGEFAFFANPQ